MIKKIYLFLFLFSLGLSQEVIRSHLEYFKDFKFTRADSLRGTLSPLRNCYDVTYYDLFIRFDFENKKIYGSNTIKFLLKNPAKKIQIDLFKNMKIKGISYEGKPLKYTREFNAVFLEFPEELTDKEKVYSVRIDYYGRPLEATNPPWDGGFVWKKHDNKHWVTVACEGIGASLWWPNKDHFSEEPDSMRIVLEVPRGYQAISNGDLLSVERSENGDSLLYEWYVTYPINNYNVTFYVGDYYHFQDKWTHPVAGELKLDYYVLPENAVKARKHFQQVKKMLTAFDGAFGLYPFWVDGYALVEAPYWGMEHQSAIAYGNKYKNNMLGFDYIIIHESAHEWFGNSITASDIAEMWIHETFATYAEAVYVEKTQGYKRALFHLKLGKSYIRNKYPILAPYGVNFDKWPGSDMYYKGAWMLHTLRSIFNDDEAWWNCLKEFYETYEMKTVTTDEVVRFFDKHTDYNCVPFFRQYLTHPLPPRFKYSFKIEGKKKDKKLVFRYKLEAEEKDLTMPVEVAFGRKTQVLNVTTDWQTLTFSVGEFEPESFQINRDKYYLLVREE